MQDRPYLVQLENVEHECINLMMFLLIAGFVPVYIALMLFQHLGVLSISLFLLYFTSNINLKYKTDIDGLYVEVRSGLTGYKWKRILKWTDVSAACWGNMDTGKIDFVLHQGWRRSVVIGRTDGRMTRQSISAMEASIFQHLQRVGVSNVFEPRLYADSYWMEIPTWIPDTVTVEREEGEFVMTYSVSPETLEVTWVPKDENHFFAGCAARDLVDFTRVHSCSWENPNKSDLELSIVADDVDTTIRANYDEPEMLKLMLAVIRQIKVNKADAVWLPDVLVEFIQSGVTDKVACAMEQ